MSVFTDLSDVVTTVWDHEAGVVTQEFDDAPIAMRLPHFAPADHNDLREVSVRLPIVRREFHEPSTYSTPAWNNIDVELDRRSPTLLTVEGIVSCLLPDAAAGLLEELTEALIDDA